MEPTRRKIPPAGAGRDKLWGDARTPGSGDSFGADLFVVGTNDGNDTIYDFRKHGDLDLIDLKALALTWSDLLARSSLTVGQGFVIQLGPSANPSAQSLTIVDTGATAGATIQQEWFVL